MSAHRALQDIHNADPMPDPGPSGTITVDRSPARVVLNSAGAESRTLANPTRSGVQVLIQVRTAGGTITLTVTDGYNPDGDTTFSLTTAGHFIKLESVETSAATFRWRKVSDYALANIAAADSAVLDELGGLTATVSEINNVADASARTATLTAAGLVLTAAETGKIYFINNATGFVAATLPAAAVGLEFTFINKTANTSGNHTIVTASSANIIQGNQNSVAGDAGDTGTADDTISFVANQSVPGDKVYLISDGTSWFAYAISRVAAGITFTQASA